MCDGVGGSQAIIGACAAGAAPGQAAMVSTPVPPSASPHRARGSEARERERDERPRRECAERHAAQAAQVAAAAKVRAQPNTMTRAPWAPREVTVTGVAVPARRRAGTRAPERCGGSNLECKRPWATQTCPLEICLACGTKAAPRAGLSGHPHPMWHLAAQSGSVMCQSAPGARLPRAQV